MAEVGGTSSCINPLDRDSDGEETLRTSLKGSYQPPKPVAWPKHSPEGKLDFPKGEVLAAKELIQRATKAFGVNYVFDNRIADNLIFCQGKFDDKSFLKILNQLTIPFNAIPAPSPDADSKLIQDQFRRKVFPLLDESLFPPGTDRSSLEGKSLTVAELSKLNSTFAQIADRDKRDGNDSVKVSAIPCFYAVAVSDRIEDATLRWSMMIRP